MVYPRHDTYVTSSLSSPHADTEWHRGEVGPTTVRVMEAAGSTGGHEAANSPAYGHRRDGARDATGAVLGPAGLQQLPRSRRLPHRNRRGDAVAAAVPGRRRDRCHPGGSRSVRRRRPPRRHRSQERPRSRARRLLPCAGRGCPPRAPRRPARSRDALGRVERPGIRGRSLLRVVCHRRRRDRGGTRDPHRSRGLSGRDPLLARQGSHRRRDRADPARHRCADAHGRRGVRAAAVTARRDWCSGCKRAWAPIGTTSSRTCRPCSPPIRRR